MTSPSQSESSDERDDAASSTASRPAASEGTQRDGTAPPIRLSATAPVEVTGPWAAESPACGSPELPAEEIGRYRLVRLLGQGGFGAVYQGWDNDLGRAVAIKVPHRHRMGTALDAEAYLSEARVVATLDHPGIVPVYDVGRTADGLCYVVSKFIEGEDLASRLRRDRPSPSEAARCVARVAQALHHAHLHGIVHRDIKPANILLDRSGTPYVTDFGLALRRQEEGQGPTQVGTPTYMSPEQARGESHRVDGRSDVYNLGVVFYLLLTGRRPFQAIELSELLALILTAEVSPPRSLDPTIPAELERICLKALARRASDRYATALDLATDLEQWQTQDQRPPRREPAGEENRLVPRGLRPFDATDADAFLDLLPGPRERDGLPQAIHFWKSRVEAAEPSFPVGLLLGSSGSGKSSLIKAGLLPRLADHVTAVYAEATPGDTEAQLLSRLRRQCPKLPVKDSLVEPLAAVRRGRDLPVGHKVLLVLDQFEQWLAAHPAGAEEELVAALRQCDGERLQALLVVRDDFALAVTHFLDQLEVPLVQGRNFAAMDRFELGHARAVLGAFGRAYGRLPSDPHEMSREQEQFLERVVGGLAEGERVIAVRLALFAEMFKDRPWTPAALRAVGGAEGIGVAFLEETFSAPTANPRLQHHEQTARRVLGALLPADGGAIKGPARSRRNLLEAAGASGEARSFDELLDLLDGELRLITPVEAPQGSAGERHYQLTHDYLAPALRHWLARKQRETRRGRAELRLAELAAAWKSRPEARSLPAFWEMPFLLGLTRRRFRGEPERRMLDAAVRYHAVRAGLTLAVLVVAGLVGLHFWHGIQEKRQADQAAAVVQRLLVAEPARVPETLTQLPAQGPRAAQLLREAQADPERSPKERRRAGLGLFVLESDQADFVVDELLRPETELVEVLLLCESLRDSPAAEPHTSALWAVLNDSKRDAKERFHAALALAMTDGRAPGWQDQAEFVAEQLVSAAAANRGQYAALVEALRPVRGWLVPPLARMFHERGAEEKRSLAVSLLAEYAQDDPVTLAELLLDADARWFPTFFPLLARHAQAVSLLETELAREVQARWTDPPSPVGLAPVDAAATRRVEEADGLVAERFALCQTLPLAELPGLAERLRASGYRPTRIRPYADGSITRVAAVWTRGSRDWQLAVGLSAREIAQRNGAAGAQGFVPVDVAGYPTVSPAEQYACVWAVAEREAGERRMLVGLNDAEIQSTRAALQAADFIPLTHRIVDLLGGRKHAAIWGKAPPTLLAQPDVFSGSAGDYSGDLFLGRLQTDVDIGRSDRPRGLRERMEDELRQVEAELLDKPEDVNLRYRRGRAFFHLGKDAEALAEWDALIKKLPDYAWMIQSPRAQLHARRGDLAAAQRDLEEFRKKNRDPAKMAYLEAYVTAAGGQFGEALRRLEDAVAQHPKDAEFLETAANAASRIAEMAARRKLPESQRYADRAMNWLGEAVKLGYKITPALRDDPDFDFIHQCSDFVALVGQARLGDRYTALWQADKQLESRELHGLPPAEHLRRCRELAEQGYRPAAIAAFRHGSDDQIVSASVWHRPVVSEADKQRLAERQANAALALLRLGRPESVWSLVEERPDPRLAVVLIELLAPGGAEPHVLIDRLRAEQNASVRRALILSLGQYTADRLPASDFSALELWLQGVYRSDPDAGVHSAAEWLLRQWGRQADMARINAELIAGQPAGAGPRPGFGWYLNRQGDTLSVSGPAEFVMGSRPAEWLLSASEFEQAHRRRIPRRFALATKEVTNAQFKRFLAENPDIEYINVKNMSLSPDGPALGVGWFVAIRYCRWLTQKEGIAPEQQCYPPIDKRDGRESLGLRQGYLARAGYRLPTEVEWEYAARAGTVTRRFTGWTDESLQAYEWSRENTAGRDTPVGAAQPVGRLKPNPLGLFDMLGNAREWTTDRYGAYPSAAPGATVLDMEHWAEVDERDQFAVRGGSFTDPRNVLRSALRVRLPSSPTIDQGFRVARTIPD